MNLKQIIQSKWHSLKTRIIHVMYYTTAGETNVLKIFQEIYEMASALYSYCILGCRTLGCW